MKNPFMLSLSIIYLVLSELVVAQVMPPPRNLSVDPSSLQVTWQHPSSVILDANFESPVFPPPNWQLQTEGIGWFLSSNGGSSYFPIPPHTSYAVMNDDTAGQANNGCCDFLITPTLDLTQYPGYKLFFSSFYTGAYGIWAYIELSFDGGISWNPIYTLTPSDTWKDVSVNLSAYSGVNGFSSVKIGFHADDGGLWGTGCAIDDIKISSEAMEVTGYNFYVGDSLITTTGELSCQIPPDLAH